MAKQINRSELEQILQKVGQFTDGASLEQINEGLAIPTLRRSLQRRLEILVKEGHIFIEGKSRARKYFLAKKTITPSNATTTTETNQEGFISLSSKSIEVQKLIKQPIQARKYVNYNRELLDEYQPNATRYLSEQVCQRLSSLGKTDGERPAGTYAKQIFNRLLVDLSWNSSRLEGNTYSLLETERLVELSEIAEGKDLKEAQMILNHKAAIEFLIDSADDIGINRFTILNLHALLSNNLLGNPEMCGRLRRIPVRIADTVYYPTAIPHLIEECFQSILDKAREIDNPFEQAFFLMVHLPYLQPFEDVNKRVSRLAANIPMIHHNLCPLSFVDVPQQIYINGLIGIYELNSIDLLRDVFIWAYERSCLLYSTTRRTLGEPDPFRMRHRKLIFETVSEVVRERLDKKMAITVIKQRASQLPYLHEQEQFIQSVEVELRGLHEGNIAPYRLRLSEYESWKQNWL